MKAQRKISERAPAEQSAVPFQPTMVEPMSERRQTGEYVAELTASLAQMCEGSGLQRLAMLLRLVEREAAMEAGALAVIDMSLGGRV